MRILGIDPSLTSLGYAYTVDGEATVGRVVPKNIVGMPRLALLRDTVRDILDTSKPTLIAYEGYSMGKFIGRAADLGELGGTLKLMIYERNIPILLVPPASLKMFATGKGNCDKSAVMTKMSAERGWLFTSDDEADAYALLLMGLAYSDRRHLPRDPRHFRHAALRGCSKIVGCGT
jgi:crossover junction endodeoxyribonuclease RuvC